jgi:hypothetical protein
MWVNHIVRVANIIEESKLGDPALDIIPEKIEQLNNKIPLYYRC